MQVHSRSYQKEGEGPYPGSTLYQMVIAIQKYLWMNRIKWDLVEGTDFLDVKTVLDNVMREHTEANIGVVPKRAKVITYEFEELRLDCNRNAGIKSTEETT